MALVVHRAERTDLLADGLAAVLREPQADPFAPEVVAVPTKGVERFLTQRLALVLGRAAGTDGVCANVAFPSPDDVVDDVGAQATGLDPATDPWRADRLRWVLVSQLDACLAEPWAAPLHGYLVAERDAAGTRWRGNGRLLALAQRLAGLFRSYAVERPHLIQAWAAGDDVDGAGATVPPDLAWQPALWRLVRASVDRPSPAEALAQVHAVLAADPGAVALPDRLSVFGPTRMPLLHVGVLRALAVHRDVHLWVPDPSPARWEQASRGGHPLLRSLGRDSAELAARLREGGQTTEALPEPGRPNSLLGLLQHGISHDSLPDPDERAVLTPTDRSVQIHACHGRQRQVEVLREVLLGLLQADPTLEPRDVLVMCPDVAVFAPLITAGFAVGNDRLHTAAHDLRVRVADRTPEQHNPVLAALDSLLTLATGRFTASELLDFATLDPVARRFAFDEEILDRLEQLVSAAGVRWGLDSADRIRFDVPTDQNTWGAGLDRMLAGAAMGEDGWQQLGEVLPLDDVGDGDIAAVGHLAELVDRVSAWTARLRDPQPSAGWLDTLTGAVTDLMVPSEPWQHATALGALHRLLDPACAVPLAFGDIRVLLAELLAGRPTRTNFRTGGVTVCSLVPMRSVPHRVVCLLGVDDGVFPRAPVVEGSDLLARTRQPGERDRTSEDRQLLLDAVMAATDTLVVLHTGFDEHTNEPLPAAVPVLELMDALDATALTATGALAREQILTRHPLQPFDPRNFTPDALGPGLFSHDASAFAGARASLAVREPAPPLAPAPLSIPPMPDVQLADLTKFLRDPPAFFLSKQLGLRVGTDHEADEPDTGEELPIELSPLDEWQVGDRVLRGLRGDGADAETLLAAERRRGALPPGLRGDLVAAAIKTVTTQVLDHARPRLLHERRDEPVALGLPGGRHVLGTVGGVHGNAVVTVQYGKVKKKQILDLWARVLALAVHRPGFTCGGILIGNVGDKDSYGVELRIDHLDPEAVLAELVDVMQRGLREPLPLTPRSSYCYTEARGRLTHDQSLDKVRAGFWKSSGRGECDAADPGITAVWGTADPWRAFTAHPPHADEATWFSGEESTRFGALSRRVWQPVLGGLTWLR